MWDVYIKLRQNDFQFVKRNEDNSYKVVHTTDEFPIIENVVRWFNNGSFLTKKEEFIELESRDGVDLSYTKYHYKIYNSSLKEIFSKTSRNANQFDNLKDYNEYLVINGGVIDNAGNVIIPLKYSQEEAEVRLFSKISLENFRWETNRAKALLINTKAGLANLHYINKFMAFLKNHFRETSEIVYHLLLRRYAYRDVTTSNLFNVSDSEFMLTNYDITYLVDKITNILALNEALTINYWDRYNSFYSYKKIELDLQDYLHPSDLQLLTQRKSDLDKIFSSINLMSFSTERFNKICIEKEDLLKKETALIPGRKVLIQEYQTIQSNYKNKKSNLSRTPCIYIGKPQFLDENVFPNFHLVQDAGNTSNYYVVDGNAIKNDYIRYTYNDYLEVFKVKTVDLN